MKFALLVLAVLAVASPLSAWKIPSAGSGILAKDMQQILDLIPQEEVLHLARRYLVQDKEFQTAINLVQTKESKELIKFVEASPEFKQLMAYIQKAGIDIYSLINIINGSLDLELVVPFSLFRKSTKGLLGFFKELLTLLPMEKIETTFYEMRKNSVVFNNYVEEIISSKYWNFYDSIHSNEHMLKLEQAAKEAGIDSHLFNTYYSFFVIGVPLLSH